MVSGSSSKKTRYSSLPLPLSSSPPILRRSISLNMFSSRLSPSTDLPIIHITKNGLPYEPPSFVPRNMWLRRSNMKLHPYHDQVPYMQAFDPISLESDRYTHLLFQHLTNGAPAFHDYANNPPKLVLDLGCGQGHWILHSSALWKNTEFIGLDIIDITLPAFETVPNVSLVRGDFINYELPFSDDTFDFVRMANLSLCIPQDKWDFVLGQVHRVLTPGGRFELIDDDMYYPYGDGFMKPDPEPSISPGMPDFGPTASDSLSRLFRFPSSHAFPFCNKSESSTLDHLGIDSESPCQRQCTESKITNKPTTKKIWNSSPQRPKPPREKLVLLPPIGSITSTLALSRGTRFSPTSVLQTADTSPTGSDTSSVRTMLTSPTTSVESVANVVDSKTLAWQRRVLTSKDMELLFEKMLIERYGIHPHPSEFILQSLATTFHDGAQVEMKKSFHVKLFPNAKNQQNCSGLEGKERDQTSPGDEAEGRSYTSPETSSSYGSDDATFKAEVQKRNRVTSLKPRTWVDRLSRDNRTRNKKVEENKEGGLPKFRNTHPSTTAMYSLFKRPGQPDSTMSTPVNPALSAKAAGILGIPYSELSKATASLNLASPKGSSLASRPCSPESTAKAAGRLGISYNDALAASTSLSLQQCPIPSLGSTLSPTTVSDAPSPSRPVQHTGLLIWPDTYIPMTAAELEMHACKHIHTLLGCRVALEEFVAKYVDEGGDRFIGEKEFQDEIWEYECFRRSRFNWPSEAADLYEDDYHYSGPSSATPPNSSGIVADDTTPLDDVTTSSVSTNTHTFPFPPSAYPNDLKGFPKDTVLRPVRSSVHIRSSLNRPLFGSRRARSNANSRSGSPMRSVTPSTSPYSRKVLSEALYDSLSQSRDRAGLDDLIHMRSIKVFEGIKGARR